MTSFPDIHIKKYLKPDGKIDWFEVVEPCQCRELVIPSGYVTDFASVPRWLWSVLPPHGKMANAAIKHDFWYDTRQHQSTFGPASARYFADTVFLFDMLDAQVPRWQAYFVYSIVRLFGESWWKN